MEPPYTPASLTQAAPSALLEWQESVIQERLQAAKRMVDEAQQRNGVNFEWRQVRGATVDVALQHGQYADLIIARQATPDEDTVLDIMPEQPLLGAAPPVLRVPRSGTFP